MEHPSRGKVKMSHIAHVLIGAATLLAAGCATHQSAAEDDGNSTPKAVRMAVVELSKNPDPARYSAIIAPNAQVDLAFRVSGYVVELSQTKGAEAGRWKRELQWPPARRSLAFGPVSFRQSSTRRAESARKLKPGSARPKRISPRRKPAWRRRKWISSASRNFGNKRVSPSRSTTGARRGSILRGPR